MARVHQRAALATQGPAGEGGGHPLWMKLALAALAALSAAASVTVVTLCLWAAASPGHRDRILGMLRTPRGVRDGCEKPSGSRPSDLEEPFCPAGCNMAGSQVRPDHQTVTASQHFEEVHWIDLIKPRDAAGWCKSIRYRFGQGTDTLRFCLQSFLQSVFLHIVTATSACWCVADMSLMLDFDASV